MTALLQQERRHQLREIFARTRGDLIQILKYTNPATGAIELPFGEAATFETRKDPVRLAQTFDLGKGYGMYRNVAWTSLETAMSVIEDGGPALAKDSGRSAVRIVTDLLPANSHLIVAENDLYPGTRKLFDKLLKKQAALEVTYTTSTPEALEAAFRPGQTKMVFTEPLTNPRMLVSNLQNIADFVHRHPEVISVADNTLTPLLVRPLRYDFDLVVHSLTKYAAGTNSLKGGVVIVNKNSTPKRGKIVEELIEWRDGAGGIIAPTEAYNITRHVKDFSDRFAVHCDNTEIVAQWLSEQPEVSVVHFPGLKSSPYHELANKQFLGLGGLLSFELKGGVKEVESFLAALKDIPLADSFGADVSLANYYARQSKFFASKTPEERAAYGITDTFIRLGVGREHPQDIINDLARGLDAVAASNGQNPIRTAPDFRL